MQEDPNILESLGSLSCVSRVVIERALHKENTNQKKQTTDSEKNELMIRFLTSKQQYRIDIDDFGFPDELTNKHEHIL